MSQRFRVNLQSTILDLIPIRIILEIDLNKVYIASNLHVKYDVRMFDPI